MNKPKFLELFAGDRSMSKAAEELGFEVCSIDIEPYDNIDIVKDVEDLEVTDLPFIPDALHAGVLCFTYSMMQVGKHRDGPIPKTKEAKKSDRLVKKTLKLIDELLILNPNLKWTIENPRAMLRKMPFMKGLNRTTVTYCSYGDTRFKATDIWSNHIYDIFYPKGWKPRPMCFKNNSKCQHESARRPSTIKKSIAKGIPLKRGGTQDYKNSYERAKMPPELCKEIIKSFIN